MHPHPRIGVYPFRFPWATSSRASRTVPGDLPFSENLQPVVTLGTADRTTGKFVGLPADDEAFTFQDPEQALGPGADMEFNVDMLNHDMMILALLDSSGNAINVDIIANNPTTLTGPYAPFAGVGVSGSNNWLLNKETNNGELAAIVKDTNTGLAATWTFYKLIHFRGTQVRLVIHNNDGSNPGIISTAFMRLV